MLKYYPVLLLVLLSAYFSNLASARMDFQEALLGFYTQELLAHGAMFFAATAATFRLITGFIDKTNRRFLSSTIFVFLS